MLNADVRLAQREMESFHGFAIARELQRDSASDSLTRNGTIYRALARLEKAGYLTSRWEDPVTAAHQNDLEESTTA